MSEQTAINPAEVARLLARHRHLGAPSWMVELDDRSVPSYTAPAGVYTLDVVRIGHDEAVAAVKSHMRTAIDDAVALYARMFGGGGRGHGASGAAKPCPSLDCYGRREVEWDGFREACRVVCKVCGLAGPPVAISHLGDTEAEDKAIRNATEAEAVAAWNNIPRPNGTPYFREEVAAVLAIMDAMPDSWTCCEMIRLRCRTRLRAALERSDA